MKLLVALFLVVSLLSSQVEAAMMTITGVVKVVSLNPQNMQSVVDYRSVPIQVPAPMAIINFLYSRDLEKIADYIKQGKFYEAWLILNDRGLAPNTIFACPICGRYCIIEQVSLNHCIYRCLNDSTHQWGLDHRFVLFPH